MNNTCFRKEWGKNLPYRYSSATFSETMSENIFLCTLLNPQNVKKEEVLMQETNQWKYTQGVFLLLTKMSTLDMNDSQLCLVGKEPFLLFFLNGSYFKRLCHNLGALVGVTILES